MLEYCSILFFLGLPALPAAATWEPTIQPRKRQEPRIQPRRLQETDQIEQLNWLTELNWTVGFVSLFAPRPLSCFLPFPSERDKRHDTSRRNESMHKLISATNLRRIIHFQGKPRQLETRSKSRNLIQILNFGCGAGADGNCIAKSCGLLATTCCKGVRGDEVALHMRPRYTRRPFSLSKCGFPFGSRYPCFGNCRAQGPREATSIKDWLIFRCPKYGEFTTIFCQWFLFYASSIHWASGRAAYPG